MWRFKRPQIPTSLHTFCGRQGALSLAGVDPTLGDLDKQSLGPTECEVFGRLILVCPLLCFKHLLVGLNRCFEFVGLKIPLTHGMCVC